MLDENRVIGGTLKLNAGDFVNEMKCGKAKPNDCAFSLEPIRDAVRVALLDSLIDVDCHQELGLIFTL